MASPRQSISVNDLSLRRPGAVWMDYVTLTKPTITLLVVITAIPSLLLALPGLPAPDLAIATLVGTALASASAGIFNQIVEIGVDDSMERTKYRSMPRGKVKVPQALVFATLLGVLGLAILGIWTTKLAALIALAGHAFYVLGYTMFLKKRTAQNIVIGGAAGAVGPLIGWAAVTGHLAWPAWALFLIITLWTPPHFWALAIKYKQDYAQAGIPMYPVVYGDASTRWAMMIYTYTLFPPIIALFLGGYGGKFYLIVSLVLTGKFAWDATQIYRSQSNRDVMRFFHYSCLYTFGIFGALTLDSLIMRAF